MKRVLVIGALAIAPLLLRAEMLPSSQPRFFAAKPGSLQKAKQRLAASDKDLAPALKKLVDEAEKALLETPPSVTEKSKVAPSHDRHDYASLAPYFWPDPKRPPNGLPYVRHDGKVNPESKDPESNDGPRVAHMSKCVETLALAYYFTGNEAYAAQAARFVRTWFLDPEKKMNPHLKYAQAIRGVNNGRDSGILEARNIAMAADSLGLLAGSKSWTLTDQQEMDKWLNTFYNWLMTSRPGREEHASKNNHGTWFDVQSARLALCLGHNEVATRIIKDAMRIRVAAQIEKDGSQPLELVRTAAFSYSWFNIEALTELATLGEHAGVDLWHFSTGDGRSILRAIEFMVPYVDVPPKDWPYQQIKERKEEDYLPVLREAALAYRAPEFDAIIAKYPGMQDQRFQLLFVK